MLIFALLAVVGLVGTWKYNFDFMREAGGLDLVAFARAPFSEPACGSIAVDFYVSFTAGLIFLLSEARRLRIRHAWVYVLLLAVAWAVSLPLFLLHRERALARG